MVVDREGMNVRSLILGWAHAVGTSDLLAHSLAARLGGGDEYGLLGLVVAAFPSLAPHATAAVPASPAVPSPSLYLLSRISLDLAPQV